MSLEKSILARVEPAAKERKTVQEMVLKALEAAKEEAKKYDPEIRVELAGSYPKDTWLAGLHEIDVFFLFPSSYDESELEEDAMPLLHAVAERLGGIAQEKYAQHPYLAVKVDEFLFDLVPAFYFRAKSAQLASAVDRTPLHTEYVKKHLKKTGDVRLLKRFCKGIGVYGADMKVQGFSGYLCELLVLKFGSFVRVLRAAENWKPPILIEIEKRTKKTKVPEQFVVIDPVDEARNVAAAVSQENLVAFISAAKAYLKKPSESFFFPQSPPLPEKLSAENFFVVEFGIKKTLEDIAYSQLRRLAGQLNGFLHHQGFDVKSSAVFVSSTGLVLMEVGKTTLSPLAVVRGPPTGRPNDQKRFQEKHEGHDTFTEVGRLWARVPRKFIHVNDALAAANLVHPSYIIGPRKVFSSSHYYDKADEAAKLFLVRKTTKKQPWEVN